MTTATVRPHPRSNVTSAFVYLRRLPSMDDAAVQEAVTALTAFSIRQGFSLAGIHYEEHRTERLDTWMELITSCRSEGVTNVLVLSADHFHHDPTVAAYMREELAEKIRGTVRLASESTATSSPAPADEAGDRDR